MGTVTFDTLKFADTLKAAGIPAAHAEAEARAVSAAIGEVDVATKRDLEALENRLNAKFSLTDAKIDKLAWMIGILIALAVANFAKQYF